MRRFAISDIHGCAKTFKKLLRRINFSQEDVLYLLGDYLDRGPDGKGVIDHIFELQKNGFEVHCLRGNHEQYFLDAYYETESTYTIPQETLTSFEVENVKDVPKVYLDWMNRLPYFFDLEDYLLVHAGLNFKSDAPLEDEAAMIWIRHWYDDIDEEWLGNQIVVHGHTPYEKWEIKKNLHHLEDIPAINIDAGCVFESYGFGHLCALNLGTKQLIFEDCMDVVSYRVKDVSHPVPNQAAPNDEFILDANPETKILYFDIDGTFLDYDDVPKTAFLNGQLEASLKKANFDYLACVSGWVDIFADKVMKLDSLEQRKTAMYQLLEPMFPDKNWFIEKLILISDTDARCTYMDLKTDWFYVDNWADKFFTAAHGEKLFKKHKGDRVLLCDHQGDGSDILEWLNEKTIKYKN